MLFNSWPSKVRHFVKASSPCLVHSLFYESARFVSSRSHHPQRPCPSFYYYRAGYWGRCRSSPMKTAGSVKPLWQNFDRECIVQGCHGPGKVREQQKLFKVREFCKRTGKILEVCKSQGIIFSVRKVSWKMIDLRDVCTNSSFDKWFSVVS